VTNELMSVSRYLRKNRVSFELSQKIKDYIVYLNEGNSQINQEEENQVLSRLSPSLRQEL
jgi:hypothetical protein